MRILAAVQELDPVVGDLDTESARLVVEREHCRRRMSINSSPISVGSALAQPTDFRENVINLRGPRRSEPGISRKSKVRLFR
jgi:hypothetical protein